MIDERVCDRPVVGVVLAGGFSVRYGECDKALAPVDGTPMLRRVVERVGTVAEAVLVNCRRDQRAAFADVLAETETPLAFVFDPVSDAGPLAGLAAALACHNAPVTVLAGCDMPHVDPAFLASMLDQLDADAVVPAPDTHLQPAQAVYRTEPARTAVMVALDDGHASLRAMVDRLDINRLGPETLDGLDTGRTFRDVNRPSERQA